MNKKDRYETRRDSDKYRQSELKGEIASNEEVLNEVESLRQEIRILRKINTKYKAILGPV